MSNAPSAPQPTTQTTVPSNTDTSKPLQPSKAAGAAAQLEEDDEFEDFPVEDWAKEEEVGNSSNNATGSGSTHLWEESWDDDHTSDDFSVQLKEEIKRMEAQRKG